MCDADTWRSLLDPDTIAQRLADASQLVRKLCSVQLIVLASWDVGMGPHH